MKARNYGVDIIRLFCVITIFYFHGLTNLNCSFGIINGFIRVGAMCMTGFFMLSGYVLFQKYCNSELIEINNLKIFYKKRIISLAPMYLVTYVLWMIFLNKDTLVDSVILFPVEISGTHMFFNGLFHSANNNGTWFVSCFIFAYLFFPFLNEVIKQMKKKGLIILFIIISLFLLYAPLLVWMLSIDGVYSNPIFRFLEFTLGVILAQIVELYRVEHGDANKFNNKKIYPIIFVLVLAVMIVACCVAVALDIAPWNYSLYIWIGLPCFTVLLLLSQQIKVTGKKIRKTLEVTSAMAYNFFLVSFFTEPLTELISSVTRNYENIFRIIIATVVNCLLTVFFYFVIDKKITYWLINRSHNQKGN